MSEDLIELRAFIGRVRLSTRVTPLDLARVWFADEKMFRLSVRPCHQNQRVWLRRSESKTAHHRSESSEAERGQSSQAESLQGVMVALAVFLVHGFSPVHVVREHCKVSSAVYQGSCATISYRSVCQRQATIRVAARQRAESCCKSHSENDGRRNDSSTQCPRPLVASIISRFAAIGLHLLEPTSR